MATGVGKLSDTKRLLPHFITMICNSTLARMYVSSLVTLHFVPQTCTWTVEISGVSRFSLFRYKFANTDALERRIFLLL
jgi:hypothetical protein